MMKFFLAALTGLVAGLTAAPESSAPPVRERVAVVVDASGAGATERLATARAAAARQGAELRAPRTLHDQLSVTARLAAEGYTTIIGYGLEEYASIAPLDGRVRYVAAI
jgi:hypothetical protein